MGEFHHIIDTALILIEQINNLEEQLKELKAQKKLHLETYIPDYMYDADFLTIETQDYTVRVDSEYFVKYKDEEKAIRWFIENGFDIFDLSVLINFNSLEDREEYVKKSGQAYKFINKVHWKTMGSTLRQLVAEGCEFPSCIEVNEVKKSYIGVK